MSAKVKPLGLGGLVRFVSSLMTARPLVFSQPLLAITEWTVTIVRYTPNTPH